jgi:hypothetical protein
LPFFKLLLSGGNWFYFFPKRESLLEKSLHVLTITEQETLWYSDIRMLQPRTLPLRMAYNLVPRLVEGLEDRNRMLLIPYLSKDLGHLHLVKVAGEGDHTFEFDVAIPPTVKLGEPFISPSSGMTIRVFAAGKNAEGTTVMTQAGSVFVPSSVLFNNMQNVDTGFMDLTVPNAADHERGIVPTKGQIQLIINRMDFPMGRNPIKPVSEYDYVPENADRFGTALVHYMERAGLPYTELAPTFANAKELRMPWWVSGHLQAPGMAFAAPRADPSTEKWWEVGIIAAARRYHPEFRTDAQAAEWLLSTKITESEIMCVAMLHHTAVVTNATAYVSDGIYIQDGDMIHITKNADLAKKPIHEQVRARAFPNLKPVHLAARPAVRSGPGRNFTPENVKFVGMEDFSLGLLRIAHHHAWHCLSAADCEDCGAEIALLAQTLRTSSFEGPMMRKIQAIRQHYVICQALMYVNADQLSNSGRSRNLGGHMAAAYVTTHHMSNMLEEASKVKPVYEGFLRRQGPLPADYLENPVIFGEGTGLMFPLANDAMAVEMQNNVDYLGMKVSLREQSRYMMPHSKTQPSGFYNTMLSICPLEFADQYANIEQIMVKTGHGKATIGVDYLEFLNGGAKVGLIPAAPMTETELKMVRDILKHAPPIPAHRESTTILPASQPLLDQLVSHCQNLKRTSRSVNHVEYHQQFFREKDITSSALKIMQDAVSEKSRVFQVSYRPENFGENLRSYAVVFHMNP